jgi:hypothetical protein
VMPHIQILADIQAGNLDTVRAANGQHLAAVAFGMMDCLSQGMAAGVRQPSLVVTSRLAIPGSWARASHRGPSRRVKSASVPATPVRRAADGLGARQLR